MKRIIITIYYTYEKWPEFIYSFICSVNIFNKHLYKQCVMLNIETKRSSKMILLKHKISLE